MLKKIGLVCTLGLVVCVGCSVMQYFVITGSIVNTALIVAGLIGATEAPTILAGLRGVIPGL